VRSKEKMEGVFLPAAAAAQQRKKEEIPLDFFLPSGVGGNGAISLTIYSFHRFANLEFGDSIFLSFDSYFGDRAGGPFCTESPNFHLVTHAATRLDLL
jgi:hypothetical protein